MPELWAQGHVPAKGFGVYVLMTGFKPPFAKE